MGFFSSTPKFKQNPYAAGVGQQYKDWGDSQTLGMAGKIAKSGLKQFSRGGGEGGYDSGIVGNLLAPLRDQFAVAQRESNRAYGLGGLGIAGGTQPALMARLKQLNEAKIGEQMGLAYGQALPGIYNSLSNTFQSAQNARRQAELGALGGQMEAANSGQWYQDPSFLQKLSMIGNLGMQAAGMATGFGGLGGAASGLGRGVSSGFGSGARGAGVG